MESRCHDDMSTLAYLLPGKILDKFLRTVVHSRCVVYLSWSHGTPAQRLHHLSQTRATTRWLFFLVKVLLQSVLLAIWLFLWAALVQCIPRSEWMARCSSYSNNSVVNLLCCNCDNYTEHMQMCTPKHVKEFCRSRSPDLHRWLPNHLMLIKYVHIYWIYLCVWMHSAACA